MKRNVFDCFWDIPLHLIFDEGALYVNAFRTASFQITNATVLLLLLVITVQRGI